MAESKHLVVYVTVPADKAPELARTLVERRLVACVNIVPTVRSIYHWKGEICDEAESLLVMKTSGWRFDALCRAVVELHPYDVPEVVALPIVAGHDPYLHWVDTETTPR